MVQIKFWTVRCGFFCQIVHVKSKESILLLVFGINAQVIVF